MNIHIKELCIFYAIVLLFIGWFSYRNIGLIKGEINGVSYDNCSGFVLSKNCELERCAGLVASYLGDKQERMYREIAEMNCNLSKLLPTSK